MSDWVKRRRSGQRILEHHVEDLARCRDTALQLETELRSASGSVKVRTIEEMEQKLLQLAEVAGNLAANLETVLAQNAPEDYLRAES